MAGIGRSYKANLHSILAEHGKAFTESVEKCNQFLLSIVNSSPETTNATCDSLFVAHVFTTILSHNLPEITTDNVFNEIWLKGTYETLTSLLNPGILIESLKAVTGSEINWPQVIAAFQQTSQFCVRDKAGLYFLMNAIFSSTPNACFPVEHLLRLWPNNRLGQLSWIGQLVMYPDIFCFGEYTNRPLSTACLKIPPDETNKDICNWFSLELLEVLLLLADEYHQFVGEILIRRRDSCSIAPAVSCPDLLLLGIVQVGLPFNTIRSRLVNIVISQLMLHHTNAVSVLNALWNSEINEGKKGVQQLVVNGLLSFYTQVPDDTARLTKILEIAHELKPNGLGELFNVQNFQFAIDLACLASRRDFLKLDKFLGDKRQEHTVKQLNKKMHKNNLTFRKLLLINLYDSL
jgi:CCR4-NOT transcription complex subunit 1